MSFSGKRFRRTGCSNVDDFFRAANAPEKIQRLINSNAPIWCYTLLDEHRISLELQAGTSVKRHTFRLDEENEMLRFDGAKMFVTFTLEGDNVLDQKIRQPNGTIAYFRREFHDRTATMTLTLKGATIRTAHVFYEMVD